MLEKSLKFKPKTSFLLNKINHFFESNDPFIIKNEISNQKGLKRWSTFLKNKLHGSNSFENLERLPNSIIAQEIPAVKRFVNQKDLHNYMKETPSLYYKFCLFFSLNPLKKSFANNSVKFHKHHIFPLYLQNFYNDPVLSQQLDKSVNEIFIPVFIHSFLHAVRHLEFCYIDDASAACLLYNQYSNRNKLDSSTFDTKQGVLKLFSDLSELWDSKNMEVNLNRGQKITQTYIDQQSAETRLIYENLSVWKNYRFPFMPDLTIQANTVQTNGQMAEVLVKHLSKYFEKNPHIEKPFGWENRYTIENRGSVSKYINSKNQKSPKNNCIFGFYLETKQKEFTNSRENSFIQKSRKSSDPKTLDLLDSGRYQWTNSKHSICLKVLAKQYQTFPEMVYELIKLLPPESQPKDWINQKNSASPVKERITNRFREVSRGQRVSCYGWVLEKVPCFL